ncbi:MAG TPA: hypothetical protein VFX25_30065, partial [Streptosporangiaceae bacterium]|nr:hypothetical protein [Streptosporangiaceae bacterium]
PGEGRRREDQSGLAGSGSQSGGEAGTSDHGAIRLAFDQLSAAALDPEASRQRIAAAAATWAREAGLPDGD